MSNDSIAGVIAGILIVEVWWSFKNKRYWSSACCALLALMLVLTHG